MPKHIETCVWTEIEGYPNWHMECLDIRTNVLAPPVEGESCPVCKKPMKIVRRGEDALSDDVQ